MKLKDIRSIHFIPAHKEIFLENIINKSEFKPDALVFDLEDGVLPEVKDFARERLTKMFSNTPEIKKFYSVIRPNNEKTPYFKKDREAINKINPDAILLAKVEGAKEIKRARKYFSHKPLIVAIETILGVENIDEILSALNKDDAVVVGYEDLSSELKIERPVDLSLTNPLTHLLFRVYTKARKYDVQIFDAVCRYYQEGDLEILKKECEFTSNLRFSAKFSIHPNQLTIINEYFDKKELMKFADDVVQKFYGIKDGSAVIVKDNQMMDTPSLKLYKKYKENDN